MGKSDELMMGNGHICAKGKKMVETDSQNSTLFLCLVIDILLSGG